MQEREWLRRASLIAGLAWLRGGGVGGVEEVAS
jgi:hypothetical protein